MVEKKKAKLLSFRIFAYIFVLSALIIVATLVGLGRKPLEMEIRHERKQLSMKSRDGMVENSYVVKIINKTDQKQTYKVKLEDVEGLTLRSRFKEISLNANEPYNIPVSIVGDPKVIKEGHTPVTITVYSTDGQYSTSAEDVFILESKNKK